MREYHLAVIAGDGIGREVMPEALATLDAVAEQVGGLRFTYQHFDWGSDRYLAHGGMMPEDGLAILERGGFAAVLLGPVGDPWLRARYRREGRRQPDRGDLVFGHVARLRGRSRGGPTR